MIEYGQKLNHYLPALREKGVSRVLCTVNGSPSSCKLLAETIGLDTNEIELLADESGDAGRAFGVGLGWRPEDDSLNPYAKLLGMCVFTPSHSRSRAINIAHVPRSEPSLRRLVGLGASNTLPSVITGYLGNPGGKNGWIVDALAQGQRAGRWPQAALELDAEGRIVENAFDNLPLVGGWGRRPLELATLRLQTMVGVSLAKWDELQPTDPRCLTQLGGVIAVGGDGAVKYEWRDGGICHTCNFEELLEAL